MTCSLRCVDRNQLDVLDVLEGQVHTITLPINVKAVFLVAEDRWLLIESKTNRCLLSLSSYRYGQKVICDFIYCFVSHCNCVMSYGVANLYTIHTYSINN